MMNIPKQEKKNGEKSFSFLRYLYLNRELQILSIPNRILVIGSHRVNKHP